MNSKLIEIIEDAFKSVTPGKIGIRQAAARDSRYNPGDLYDNPSVFKAAMEADAKDSKWKDIPDDVLAADPAVFSHLDSLGFKFVLPAIMVWALKNKFDHKKDPFDVIGSLVIHLTPTSKKGKSTETLVKEWNLDDHQVSAVCDWLKDYFQHRESESHYQQPHKVLTQYQELLKKEVNSRLIPETRRP